MIVVDVNVLVAAHVQAHVHHEAAHAWLAAALSDPGSGVMAPDLVWVGFLRIVTNPRVFSEPATLAEASDFVRRVRAAPGYLAVPGLADGLDRFLEVCRAAETPSGLVTDAYIAAVARAHACPVATFDRDFRRFDGLAVVTPGQPGGSA
ncbi:MAG: PIN domain-containing protein [Propionibacteriaceae bacterium]|nr:PIN domain-containing protein [Propionibacteriaceae bacterium]